MTFPLAFFRGYIFFPRKNPTFRDTHGHRVEQHFTCGSIGKSQKTCHSSSRICIQKHNMNDHPNTSPSKQANKLLNERELRHPQYLGISMTQRSLSNPAEKPCIQIESNLKSNKISSIQTVLAHHCATTSQSSVHAQFYSTVLSEHVSSLLCMNLTFIGVAHATATKRYDATNASLQNHIIPVKNLPPLFASKLHQTSSKVVEQSSIEVWNGDPGSVRVKVAG